MVCMYEEEIDSEQGVRKDFLKDLTLDITKILLEVVKEKIFFR